MSNDVFTRFNCQQHSHWMTSRCHMDAERSEECACKAQGFRVVPPADDQDRPRMVPVNESAGRDASTSGRHDQDPGRSR